MRLYHFINEKYGLADLREKRLKIGRIMELNDPFEFMGVDLSDLSFRESMENTKRDLSEKFGILCFSESWNNPVQWAHYADGHKGLCLGFDISDHLLTEVNYVDERLPVDDFVAKQKAFGDKLVGEMGDYIGQPASRDEFETKKKEFIEMTRERWRKEAESDKEVESDKEGKDLMMKILATKFSHWSYEKEYRVFTPLENEEIDGLYYINFSDQLKLSEVIVGVRSCVTRAQIEDALGEVAGSVEVFKVRADFRAFVVVRDENNAF